MTASRSSAMLVSLTLVLSFSIPLAMAFDTSGLEEQLQNIEGEFAPDGGLGSLIEQLEEATGASAENFLDVRMDGTQVTMWDVAKTDWFYVHVQALMELGIVSGYKDAAGNPTGAYGPGDFVTREQALKIALGAAGVETVTCQGTILDFRMSQWARPYVLCAHSMDFDISAGTDLTKPATRAEVLHYLLAAFETEIPEGTPPFDDAKNHMYKNDIAYAYALGIVSGNPDGTFAPDRNVNRAETAKMAKLSIELL